MFVSRIQQRDEASILHADLDSFFASVEQRDDPALQGRPVAVGGGIVMAASYEAKRHGVSTPMAAHKARSLCPDLVVVPPRMSAYSEASKAVFEVFHDTTPLVEGISIDEAFLDVGGLRRIAGSPVAIAERLRAEVRERVGLPISVGVACTKFLAKVASAGAKPDGLLEVAAGEELAFLHPLPVERLWGVGPVTSAKLRGRGIQTVGDLARFDQPTLAAYLGRHQAHHLHSLSHNRDPRFVRTGVRRKSIGAQRALGWGVTSAAEVDRSLVALVDRVCRRMRDGGRVGRTVTLRLRFEDFSRATRSYTRDEATARTSAILGTARGLLAEAQPLIAEKGITLVGVAVSQLDDDDAVQLTLPFHKAEGLALDEALDAVRERFGSTAVTRAVQLGKDEGFAMPTLPDGHHQPGTDEPAAPGRSRPRTPATARR